MFASPQAALCALFLSGALLGLPVLRGEDTPVKVSLVSIFYNTNTPEQFKHLTGMMRENPRLELEMWSGLTLPGGGARAPIVMSIAGETSPDIMESWFHIIRNDIHQGFLYPLNEWIGEDRNGDGQIGDDEAIWEGWKKIPPLWRQVATKDGKIYGLPEANRSVMGILFRTDLVRNAGLDPNKPPKTWDEFYYWCMRLSDPGMALPGRVYNEGQKAIALVPHGFTWIPWISAAGGEPVRQVRRDPATGKEYAFPMDASSYVLPDGTDLGKVVPEFRADFDSKAGIAAAGFLHKMRWAPWTVDPVSGEPVLLSDQDLREGKVVLNGKTLAFSKEKVKQGVGWAQSGPRDVSAMESLARGDVAMMSWFVTDLLNIGTLAGINPDLLSWFPFPSETPEMPRVIQVQQHYVVMCTNVRLRSRSDRDEIWKVLLRVTDKDAQNSLVDRMVISGLSRFVNPQDLLRMGYGDYLRDVPAPILDIYRDIDSGRIRIQTEPYQGFWQAMEGSLNREVLSLIIAQSGRDFDYVTALKDVTRKANSGVMFARSKQELERYEVPARIIFSAIVLAIATLLFFLIRSMMRKRSENKQGLVSNPLLPWMLLFPALFLIGLWGYYPLLKGMVMAFQDFRIAGESRFVGLENFISLALDTSFWKSLLTTVYFVFLTMLLSFTSPIILAVMLSEVPRGKVLFRTLFFLPQVTSGLVIALMWKIMYDPKPNGIFNQVIAIFDKAAGTAIGPQSWLLDANLAMICVVLPTAWATAGIHSLIYLAALKSVPEDTYEACEIDGGGIWTKLRHITFPVLMPLIIINFVGAFIATFQNMGNIFLLTFGGPGEATMVAGMRIWIEAYSNLRLSIATSMAWVVGAGLIGFTFIQMQMLKRVEFRRAKD